VGPTIQTFFLESYYTNMCAYTFVTGLMITFLPY